MKQTIYADYIIAANLMDSLYELYMTIVENLDGDTNSSIARQEGENYARQKFHELATEFENNFPMTWAWRVNEDESQ